MSIFVVTMAGPAIHECWDFVHAHYASRITKFASENDDHFSHYFVDRQPSCRLASAISKASGGPQPRRRQKSTVKNGSWASDCPHGSLRARIESFDARLLHEISVRQTSFCCVRSVGANRGFVPTLLSH
jgi:hypothetical protein